MVCEMLIAPWCVAANLYDGGWRASDRDVLADEFNMKEDELDEICSWLRRYEVEDM